MLKFIKHLIEYLRYGKKKEGLVDLTDDNDFGSRAIYTPDKKDLEQALKQTFIVFNPKLLDQTDSDFCVGFGSAYEADATENFDGESGQGSGAYVFAMAKKWSGASISTFGTSLLAGAMARVKYGICNKELYDYKKGWRNWFANWNNIKEEAIEDAKKHKAGSAWRLNVPWGWTKFDAIIATLWYFKDKKVLIGSGNKSHRITMGGYDIVRKAIICFDTYGERTYLKGLRFVDRVEARTLFTSYFVLDIERDLAEILVQYDRKVVKLKNNKDCYLIKNGKKHLIPNEKTAWSRGFLLAPYDNGKLVEIITEQELNKIPLGDNVKFEGGKNEFIVRRIMEKFKIVD